MAALVAAGCGDDGDGDSGAAGPGDDGSATAAAEGAVTVEHQFGETTVDGPPERIVSIGSQWTDVLTALDAPLVGASYYEGSSEHLPWQEVPGDVEGFDVTQGIPWEVVAGLQPDLIVVNYYSLDEAGYQRSSEIAPTIPLLGDEQVDAWQDIATVAGDLLGVPEEAADLVDDAEELTAGVAGELPGLAGQTFAFANYVPGDAIYVITDPEDGANVFFSQLGLEVEPGLLDQAGGDSGRLELSPENLDMLSADLLLLLTNDTPTEDIPGYASLPAVEGGTAMVVDFETAIALNTPSPQSVPWALEQIRPVLEAAAG